MIELLRRGLCCCTTAREGQELARNISEGGLGGAPTAGPWCTCQKFRETGTCRHIPPQLGGLPTAPWAEEAVCKQDPGAKPPGECQRKVVVNEARMAWYMDESKVLSSSTRCGLFLDVDGVLHPLGAYGEDTFSRLPLLVRILEATGCSVVLSSSWRLEEAGIQEINDRLREASHGKDGDGHAFEIMDILGKPVKGSEAAPMNELGNRDRDIQRWLDRHLAEVGWGPRWIALDDLELRGALGEEHTVITKGDIGLTEADVAEAIRKLTA